MLGSNFKMLSVVAIACTLVLVSGGAYASSAELIKFVSTDAIPVGVLREFVEKRSIQEFRVATIDIDALRESIREARESIAASFVPTISLPLLDGSIVSIELREAEEHYDSWQSGMASFIGRIKGVEASSVSALIAPDGSLSLTMTIPHQGHYRIEKTTVLPYHVYWSMSQGIEGKID